MLRKRFALILAALMALAAFGFGGAQLASAAPEDPARACCWARRR